LVRLGDVLGSGQPLAVEKFAAARDHLCAVESDRRDDLIVSQAGHAELEIECHHWHPPSGLWPIGCSRRTFDGHSVFGLRASPGVMPAELMPFMATWPAAHQRRGRRLACERAKKAI
jgi:hypothetical protein